MSSRVLHTVEWSMRLIGEYLIIIGALATATMSSNVIVWWALAWLIGNRLHALGIIGHWSMHGLLPSWMKYASFIPIGIDPTVYRKSHALHHAFLGQRGKDPETDVVDRFSRRWKSSTWSEFLIDALGIRLTESFLTFKMLVSPLSIIGYIITGAVCVFVFGPTGLIYFAVLGGLLSTHRVRAKFEHNHLTSPGTTQQHTRPSLLIRWIFLPHYTWLHYEHHASPGQRVWTSDQPAQT